MPTSPIVDVVVGLVFFFSVLSLLCSVVQERIAALAGLRARRLERWMLDVLGPDARRVYEHPLVAALGGANASYLPSRTFAIALLDAFGVPPTSVTRGVDSDPIKAEALFEQARKPLADIANDRVRTVLLAHFDHARGDVEAARASIEHWFDDSMQRVSGVYKRHVQWWLLGIATVLTLLINADTLRVARTLYADPVVRAAFAERARVVGWQGEPTERSAAQLAEGLPLPLGWPEVAPAGTGWLWFGAVKVVGLVLTIAAVSLGAPFWFDILNRIVNLRASGGRPVERPEGGQVEQVAQVGQVPR